MVKLLIRTRQHIVVDEEYRETYNDEHSRDIVTSVFLIEKIEWELLGEFLNFRKSYLNSIYNDAKVMEKDPDDNTINLISGIEAHSFIHRVYNHTNDPLLRNFVMIKYNIEDLTEKGRGILENEILEYNIYGINDYIDDCLKNVKSYRKNLTDIFCCLLNKK